MHLSEKGTKFICSDYKNVLKEFCDFETEDSSIFLEHLMVHLNAVPKSRQKNRQKKYENFHFFCTLCDSDFEFTNSLAMHLKTHKDLENLQCLQYFKNDFEKDCFEIFENVKDLIEHIKIHVKEHIETLHYKCDKCEEIFDSELKLKRHNKYSHIGIKRPKKVSNKIDKKKFPCDQCGAVMSGKTELKFHVIAIHDKVKPHICQHCGKGEL